MKHIKYLDKKTNREVHQVELTKGEQYDLMKRNRAALEAEINWQQIFDDTVSFTDREVV